MIGLRTFGSRVRYQPVPSDRAEQTSTHRSVSRYHSIGRPPRRARRVRPSQRSAGRSVTRRSLRRSRRKTSRSPSPCDSCLMFFSFGADSLQSAVFTTPNSFVWQHYYFAFAVPSIVLSRFSESDYSDSEESDYKPKKTKKSVRGTQGNCSGSRLFLTRTGRVENFSSLEPASIIVRVVYECGCSSCPRVQQAQSSSSD